MGDFFDKPQLVVTAPPELPELRQSRIIGNSKNFWLWNEKDGFDLTHPQDPASEPITPRLKFQATDATITISPKKTALLIVDMQNVWLMEPFNPRGPGHDAEDILLKFGIPAAREAGIQVVWLNWGLSDNDLESINPTTQRIFDFGPDGSPTFDIGIGHEIGLVKLEDGEYVDAGRFLMRDQLNTDIHGPLKAAYHEGLSCSLPDVRFNKNRISGMCESMTECTDFLKDGGLTTLLFTGVNTDVCVAATLQDASLKKFDTILLKDGCGTTNGEDARKVTEESCRKAWGFLSTCRELEQGVRDMME
ncbi:isochorismatase family protein [Cadophora sp. DSE1049]|nr:isochorismatase family protein [Cadophora sp. DSE1049]